MISLVENTTTLTKASSTCALNSGLRHVDPVCAARGQCQAVLDLGSLRDDQECLETDISNSTLLGGRVPYPPSPFPVLLYLVWSVPGRDGYSCETLETGHPTNKPPAVLLEYHPTPIHLGLFTHALDAFPAANSAPLPLSLSAFFLSHLPLRLPPAVNPTRIDWSALDPLFAPRLLAYTNPSSTTTTPTTTTTATTQHQQDGRRLAHRDILSAVFAH